MKEYIQSMCVSPYEFLFNAVLIMMWAAFMWKTLTPRFSKKVIVCVYLFICFIIYPIVTAFPSRSFARFFSAPVLMVLTGFVFFKSKPLPTIFYSFFPGLASFLSEAIFIFAWPDMYL